MNVNAFMVEQFPFLSPDQFEPADVAFLTERAVELICTASDMQKFALEYSKSGSLYAWAPDRRAVLQAELDAGIAKLYGLTIEDLRYLLDPTDVMGDGYPSETFRVLKDNERKKYGDTVRPVSFFDAWRLQEVGATAKPAVTVARSGSRVP